MKMSLFNGARMTIVTRTVTIKMKIKINNPKMALRKLEY
jgi:hypothetical protein